MTTSVMTIDKATTQPLIKKYETLILFLLVFALTWPFMIWDALASHDILPFRLPLPVMLLQSYMPTLAAVIVVGLTTGRTGIRALFRKLLIVRVEFRWYVFAILGTAVICVAAILIANRFGPAPALPVISKDAPANHLAVFLNAALLFVVTGILNGEELAWRGFALPRLQAKYSAFTSSLILAVPWTLFHLPLFFDLNMNMPSFTIFAARMFALTILFTWLFNHTRGSVLLAYMFHAAGNTWTRIFSIDPNYHFQDWVVAGIFTTLAVIVLATSGMENLSRTNARIQE